MLETPVTSLEALAQLVSREEALDKVTAAWTAFAAACAPNQKDPKKWFQGFVKPWEEQARIPATEVKRSKSAADVKRLLFGNRTKAKDSG